LRQFVSAVGRKRKGEEMKRKEFMNQKWKAFPEIL